CIMSSRASRSKISTRPCCHSGGSSYGLGLAPMPSDCLDCHPRKKGSEEKMNDDLEKLWAEAAATGEPVDIGEIVVCDFCSEDYTDRDDEGGFLFESKATCPACAARIMPDIIKFDEEHLIKDVANPGESFKAFCLRMRAGNNTIVIRKGR